MYNLHIEIFWSVRGEDVERAVFLRHKVRGETPHIGWNINIGGISGLVLVVKRVCCCLIFDDTTESDLDLLNVRCEDFDALDRMNFQRIVGLLEGSGFTKIK